MLREVSEVGVACDESGAVIDARLGNLGVGHFGLQSENPKLASSGARSRPISLDDWKQLQSAKNVSKVPSARRGRVAEKFEKNYGRQD